MQDQLNNIKPFQALLKNFTSLSILQISNYLFPLILLPYLVRVLGVEKYGLVNFALAFSLYIVTICEYGFHVSGTRNISVNRNDPEKISEIFSSILYIKFFLFLLSSLIFISIILLIDRFRNESVLYLVSLGYVFGNVLFPNWFFQGIEKMNYILFIQILVRTVFTISVFILIESQRDFLLYMVLLASSQILIGLIGVHIALTTFKIQIKFPGFEKIKSYLIDGWNIFLSTVSINIYTTSNTFILGLFASDIIVGYFVAADKIRLAFQGIVSIISQTIFPYVNNLLKNSFNDFSLFIKRTLNYGFLLGLILSLVLFLYADEIVNLLLGDAFNESRLILKILSPLPFLILLSNIFGFQTMIPLGFDKQFNRILFIAALIHIIFLFLLIPELLALGTSVAMLITETFVSISMIIFIQRKTKIFDKSYV